MNGCTGRISFDVSLVAREVHVKAESEAVLWESIVYAYPFLYSFLGMF